MPAEVIDSRYEIIEALPRTETDSSRIYKARDTTEERVVALKVISQSALNATGLTPAHYFSTLESVKHLDHPNILRLHEYGRLEETGDLYVASEYVRGITLQERIRRVAPFSLSIAADIAVAIAEALNHAHHQGIAHGDLNPGCIVLSPEGQIKVSDFLGRQPSSGPAGSTEGSVPDTVSGFTAAAALDIYALGGIIYRMLTGTAANPAGDSLVSLMEVNPGVPQALNGVVQKAMHPSTAQRYQTIPTMLADLRVIRDSLHSGRSLAWSPLNEKRAARPPGPAVSANLPDQAISNARSEPVSAVADDTEEEGDADDERARSNAFGWFIKIALLTGIVATCFIAWKLMQFFVVPPDVTVPNLIGKTFDEAKGIATHDHFTLTEGGSDYSTKWPENQIYRQDPLAGRAVKADKEVVVYRSLGPKVLTVPDLTGMTQDRALQALQDASLPPGKVTKEYSEAAEKDIVVSQEPAKDGQVPRGTPVDFVVSKGKEPPDPPDSVDAVAIAPDKIKITWKPAAHAESYTVFRTLEGDVKTVAMGITDTQYTDTGLTPETAYTYTVTAKNAISDSGSSDAVPVTTPPLLQSPPEIGNNVPVVPSPPGTVAGSTDTGTQPDSSTVAPRMRQFTIKFRLPRHPEGSHDVKLEVQDATGTTLAFDETRDAGDPVNIPVTAFGNVVVIRIFLDGKLIKQETK